MIEISVVESLLAKFSQTDAEKGHLQDLMVAKNAELIDMKKKLIASEQDRKILIERNEDAKMLAEKILQAHHCPKK